MLHDFLIANRDELIGRCRSKVAARFAPVAVPGAVDKGVPLLLEQITESLRSDRHVPASVKLQTVSAPSEIRISAALHGAQLLRLGYTIDRVVRDYGDICQAITELAIERNAPIDTEEFHTLNRCLDDAIAAAVTSFGAVRQASVESRAESLRGRLAAFSTEHRRLVDIAIQSFSAMRTGDVGISGATGKLLVHSLEELRLLADRTLPQIQLLSEASTDAAQ